MFSILLGMWYQLHSHFGLPTSVFSPSKTNSIQFVVEPKALTTNKRVFTVIFQNLSLSIITFLTFLLQAPILPHDQKPAVANPINQTTEP